MRVQPRKLSLMISSLWVHILAMCYETPKVNNPLKAPMMRAQLPDEFNEESPKDKSNFPPGYRNPHRFLPDWRFSLPYCPRSRKSKYSLGEYCTQP
ncbi:hypothetical protein F9C07_1836332 [Aspergillus flavus]|uniref:Uncharacterized protein n=1 Tax=Aspergillus flavus (strain ATCC 200026 / FGSC A1120 / IAM 13836 / NRRL 3357 / JCM 12722 / SRRC 167) TaxID=332952 RepID=A0A7U2MWM0_ASPFN|nr:hypothetical protein F9C07_1836332 [Aspergillus flavus]